MGSVKGETSGGVAIPGVAETCISSVGGSCSEIVGDGLGRDALKLFEVVPLGYFQGVGKEDTFSVDLRETVQSNVLDSQCFAPSRKEFNLPKESRSVTPFNVAFVEVLDRQALIAEISGGGVR